MARRTRSIGAGLSLPSALRPNITRADFAGADAAVFIEGAGQRLARDITAAECAAGRPVASTKTRGRRGFTVGTPSASSLSATYALVRSAIGEIILVDDFLETLRDGVEIAAGEPAIGRKALGLDQAVARAFGEVVVVQRQPAADIGEGVLLGAHGHAVGAANMSRTMSTTLRPLLALARAA